MQPCRAHARRPWQHATKDRHARGYDADYERNRRTVMAEETHCWICLRPGLEDDQADHVVPLARGGSSARTNLRRAHRECNQARRA
jgi:5-methylcytosine-specific restriction protein A